jgi:hypothetical protein
MEFFRGFFGREGKQDLDSEIEKKKKELSSRKESGMSRRDFLKIAGAALASTSFDRIQPEKSKSERIMVEKESDNAYQELIASLQNAKEEFNVGDPESFIPENNLRIHDEFLRKYGGVLEHFFTQVGKNIPHIDSAEGQKRFLGMMEKVFQETSLFRAQGTVYSFLERHNLYEVFRTVMKPENFYCRIIRSKHVTFCLNLSILLLMRSIHCKKENVLPKYLQYMPVFRKKNVKSHGGDMKRRRIYFENCSIVRKKN